MARNVTYSVAPRINPRDKEAAPKFYARAQASGDVSVREMAERIQASCTVTKADVQAVLVALEDVIIDALKGGEIVRLGDLGTFQIGLSGKGAEGSHQLPPRCSFGRYSDQLDLLEGRTKSFEEFR